jgi:ADP-heptose:LPS heptosyltransferase
MRLEVPGRVFVIPPVGLGDFIAWLPVFRNIRIINAQVEFIIPEKYKSMGVLYEMAKLAVFWASPKQERNSSDFLLALCLNDESEDYDAYAGLLRKAPYRIGLKGGRYREGWLTHKVSPSVVGFPRHESHRNARLLKVFGLDSVSFDRTIKRVKKEDVPDRLRIDKLVVVHPFSNGHAREWPIENHLALAELLYKRGYNVWITGSKNEAEKIKQSGHVVPEGVINACGRLDIGELLSLLSVASLVVAASTGPLHLAASLGAQTLGLYVTRKGMGPDRWRPIGQNAYFLSVRKTCRKKVCDQRHCNCMRALTVSDVEKVSLNLLADEVTLLESSELRLQKSIE